jgi:hypothetical protein
MRLQDFRAYFPAASGSPKCTAKLYADNNGVPGTLIEAGAESAVIVAGTWVTLGGFTAASNLTEGAMYWILVFCTSGTSANVATSRGSSTSLGIPVSIAGSAAGGTSWGGIYLASFDNASSWGGGSGICVSGNRIGITDGTDTAYFGFPIATVGVSTGATEKLYTNAGNAQEFGSQFTSPPVTIKVKGVVMYARDIGATGNLRYRIYTGSSPSLLATTNGVPPGNILNASPELYVAYFSAIQTINPSTVLSVVAGNSAADDSSHYYAVSKYTIDSDADSLNLWPYGGIQSIKLPANTKLNSEFVPFYLLLDEPGFVAPTFPAASKVYSGTDRGDGTMGTLHASNISTAAGAGSDLAAGDLRSGTVVDDVTGTYTGSGGGGGNRVFGSGVILPLEAD